MSFLCGHLPGISGPDNEVQDFHSSFLVNITTFFRVFLSELID